MATMVPYFEGLTSITCHAKGAIVGKRAVVVSGEPVDGNVGVVQAGADAAIVGVATVDKASGEKVEIYTAPGAILPLEAGAAIAAGADLSTDASGRFITAVAGPVVARALASAAGAASDVMAKLL